MDDVKWTFPIVFEHTGSHKRHSSEYRRFGERWNSLKTLYEVADEKIEKVEKIYQLHLNDYLQYLSYMIDKMETEEIEEAYQEQIRKLKK